MSTPVLVRRKGPDRPTALLQELKDASCSEETDNLDTKSDNERESLQKLQQSSKRRLSAEIFAGNSDGVSFLETESEDKSINVEVKNSAGDQKSQVKFPPEPPSSSQKSPSSSGLEYPGFFSFFWSEIHKGYALENDEARYTEKRKKVYAFIKIPRELERFLLYGFSQCTDAFLYYFTFLPIRFILAIVHLLASPIIGGLVPSEKCDILKVVLLAVVSLIMNFVDTSFMYHLVRGQAVIKLYIFFNMLEVADRLFSSFGQDILDALFWTATEPQRPASSSTKKHFGTLWHLALAIIYVWLHTMLVLFQATTLNVAFNSHNKALLTIMLSNNFVELKGSVFKKFAKSNLFQMACSDVRERFHYVILLLIVVVRNMTAVNWKVDHFSEMLPDLALVLCGEFVVDWLKHAFITKFNEIPYEVYKDFTITIAYDVAKSRQEKAFSDHSDQVSRRMGFIPLPLSALLIRILTQSLKIDCQASVWIFLLFYILLIAVKVLNSIILLGKAARYIETYEKMLEQAKWLERIRKTKSRSAPASPRLGLIEFSDIMQQYHTTSKYTVSDILTHAAELAAVQREDEEQRERAASIQRSKSVAFLFSSERVRQNSGQSATPIVAPPPELDSSLAEEPADINIQEDLKQETTKATPQHSPSKRQKMQSECEALAGIDRYTLLENDRIEG